MKRKQLTSAKIDRAILALVEVMETQQYDPAMTNDIDRVCAGLREMRTRAV